MARALVWPALLVAASPDFAQEPQPRWDEIILVSGNEAHAPARSEAFPWSRHVHGERTVEVHADRVVVRHGDDVISADLEAGFEEGIEWLGGAPHLAFLAVGGDLRALDLDEGEWLALPDFDGEQDVEWLTVAGAHVDHLLVVLLAELTEDPGWQRATEPVRHLLVAFDLASDPLEVEWSAPLESAGEVPYTGGYLFAPRRPVYGHSVVRPLTPFADDLLVCTGPLDPIRRISPWNGEEVWSLERVWEFERGFIGPSVWNHYVGRFGQHDMFADEDEAKEHHREARAAFDARWSCALVGGPAVIEKPSGWSGRREAFLVVASKAPAAEYAGYLSEAWVYEVCADGEPVALAPLPRLVHGWAQGGDEGAAVWACQGSAFVAVGASDNDGSMGMSLGGPDAVARVLWYREEPAPSEDAWLVTDPAGDPVAVLDGYAVRPAGGGYVREEGDPTFHFPLSRVPLDGSASSRIELVVPLTAEVIPPETNYSRVGDTWHVMGARHVGVTWLEASGDELLVTVASEGDARVLLFPRTSWSGEGD